MSNCKPLFGRLYWSGGQGITNLKLTFEDVCIVISKNCSNVDLNRRCLNIPVVPIYINVFFEPLLRPL